jgi:hypothetical protein
MLAVEDNTDLNILKLVHNNGVKVRDQANHKDLISGIKIVIQ